MESEPAPEQAAAQPAATEADQQGAGRGPALLAPLLENHPKQEQGQGENSGTKGGEPHPGGLQEHRQGHQQGSGRGQLIELAADGRLDKPASHWLRLGGPFIQGPVAQPLLGRPCLGDDALKRWHGGVSQGGTQGLAEKAGRHPNHPVVKKGVQP